MKTVFDFVPQVERPLLPADDLHGDNVHGDEDVQEGRGPGNEAQKANKGQGVNHEWTTFQLLFAEFAIS